MTNMNGKTAVVTGGGSPAGRAVCRAFARCGARVAVCDRDPGEACRAAEELRAGGADAEGFGIDLGDRRTMEGVCQAISSRFGGIDILVNNDNVELEENERAPLHEIDMDRCERIIDAGIKGFFTFSKLCMREMALRGGGSVVNVTSVRGLVPVANQTPVVAVSAAVIGMTRMWGVELRDERIRVNAVAAGIFSGGGNRLAHLAVRRPADPEDIAAAALFLASDAASYVTGAVLPVDGGLNAGYVRSF